MSVTQLMLFLLCLARGDFYKIPGNADHAWRQRVRDSLDQSLRRAVGAREGAKPPDGGDMLVGGVEKEDESQDWIQAATTAAPVRIAEMVPESLFMHRKGSEGDDEDSEEEEEESSNEGSESDQDDVDVKSEVEKDDSNDEDEEEEVDEEVDDNSSLARAMPSYDSEEEDEEAVNKRKAALDMLMRKRDKSMAFPRHDVDKGEGAGIKRQRLMAADGKENEGPIDAMDDLEDF